MSDIGKITEIEPEDGLGWIELESGDRVRFGGTACKGFVPAIGMVVRVVGTRPGYGGTVKATELARVADAPKEFADRPAAEGAAPQPRTNLHAVQSSGVRADDLLLKLLGRADVDDGLHADLEAASFRPKAAPGLEIGCRNPWFYAVAEDGAGNAYGLYAHPMFAEREAAPWLLWRSDLGALRFVADDSATLFARVLASAAAAGVDAQRVARLRADLEKLGMPQAEAPPVGEGEKVGWLPPDEAELRPLDDYLAETDGGEMERGLLAHAFREGGEARAAEALRSLYGMWQWSLPAWAAG